MINILYVHVGDTAYGVTLIFFSLENLNEEERIPEKTAFKQIYD